MKPSIRLPIMRRSMAKNYQATFTAKLFYPSIDHYEVMPWPERIYTHPYKLANSDSAVLIPKYYSTQMQVMVNVLNGMPLSSNVVNGAGSIAVVMGNSNMKPDSASVHALLADWVRNGGVLVYCGKDDDPYQPVMEWWDTKGN